MCIVNIIVLIAIWNTYVIALIQRASVITVLQGRSTQEGSLQSDQCEVILAGNDDSLNGNWQNLKWKCYKLCSLTGRIISCYTVMSNTIMAAFEFNNVVGYGLCSTRRKTTYIKIAAKYIWQRWHKTRRKS